MLRRVSVCVHGVLCNLIRYPAQQPLTVVGHLVVAPNTCSADRCDGLRYYHAAVSSGRLPQALATQGCALIKRNVAAGLCLRLSGAVKALKGAQSRNHPWSASLPPDDAHISRVQAETVSSCQLTTQANNVRSRQ